jgi:hypothetical protein
MDEKYLTIPIPVAPEDADLPLSVITLKLPSGKLAQMVIPVQGEGTIDNAIATLNLWKRTLVKPVSAAQPVSPPREASADGAPEKPVTAEAGTPQATAPSADQSSTAHAPNAGAQL